MVPISYLSLTPLMVQYTVPWYADASGPEDRKALLKVTLVRTLHSQ